MFYKLVQNTDFDALDGMMMMTSQEIIAVTAADNKKDAEILFDFMKRRNLIYYTADSVEIEEATREEFQDWISR